MLPRTFVSGISHRGFLTTTRFLTTTQVVGHDSSARKVFGSDAWRYDKGAFKAWVSAAAKKGSHEEKQMYGWLALSFGDVDIDKDGFIDAHEFDALLEKVAALPRRFGLAPSWREEYNNDKAARTKARQAMFDSIDGDAGHAKRGKIAMAQFLQFAHDHIVKKAVTLDNDSEATRVAFRHIEDYTKEQYVAYLREAIADPSSTAGVTLYNYLLTSFVEADEDCRGQLNFEEFDKLVDLAAKTPRYFKLAPDSRDVVARRAMFDEMDSTKEGVVTFRKFLRFTRVHIKAKLAAL